VPSTNDELDNSADNSADIVLFDLDGTLTDAGPGIVTQPT